MKKIIILISIAFCFLLISYILKEESSSLTEENIKLNQNNALAFYIQKDEDSEEYTSSSDIPDINSGYIFTHYTCNDETVITFDHENWALEISNIQSGTTKCSMYFDFNNIKNYILSDNKIVENEPSFTSAESSNLTGYLYQTEDDEGISYYYRGNVTNNYVSFAGFYWRIIRINGDGSVRMIYQGKSADATGTNAQIGNINWNSSYNDNAYEGYMYGVAGSTSYDVTHANTNNSAIKEELDTWYRNNLINYNEYLDGNSGFCNDRQIAKTSYNNHGTLGYGNNATSYAPAERVWGTNWSVLVEEKPTLKCGKEEDIFTTKDSPKGNKALTYPIGLLTIDEVIYAGAFLEESNNTYYLYTGQNYWVMSPGNFDGTRARIFMVNNTGSFQTENANSSLGIRPVINLKADVQLTGSGTASDPYVVVRSE